MSFVKRLASTFLVRRLGTRPRVMWSSSISRFPTVDGENLSSLPDDVRERMVEVEEKVQLLNIFIFELWIAMVKQCIAFVQFLYVYCHISFCNPGCVQNNMW